VAIILKSLLGDWQTGGRDSLEKEAVTSKCSLLLPFLFVLPFSTSYPFGLNEPINSLPSAL
jgi:hypothetical protein